MADRSQQAHPSDSLTVFAYGSNLCSAWLRGRTPGARVAGTGYLDGFRLEFTKIGRDGSAKATVAPAGASAAVPGVLYRIPEDEMDALDRAERGYERTFHTIRSASGPTEALVYVAEDESVDPGRKPFAWYVRLVLAGIREHGLPAEHGTIVERVATHGDPDASRRRRALRCADASPR